MMRSLIRQIPLATLSVALLAIAPRVSTAQAAPSVPPSDSTTSLVALVVQKGTDTPVANAAVGLASGKNMSGTDAEGYSAGSGLPVGKQELRVRMKGYLPFRLLVELKAGVVDTVKVELVPPGSPPAR